MGLEWVNQSLMYVCIPSKCNPCAVLFMGTSYGTTYFGSPTLGPRVTTKTFSAVFSAENNCLILEILGLGKNSRFQQQYPVFGNFLILGTKSNI